MVDQTIEVDKEIKVPKVILEDREIQIPEAVYETKTVKVPRQRVITEYEEVPFFFLSDCFSLYITLLGHKIMVQLIYFVSSKPSRSQPLKSEFIKSKSHERSPPSKRFSNQ